MVDGGIAKFCHITNPTRKIVVFVMSEVETMPVVTITV